MSQRVMDLALRNTVVDEGHRVVIYGELGETVINDVLYEFDEGYGGFSEAFEIDSHDYLADEDKYQGLNLTRLIRRKSDGALFGFTYWKDISKHGESSIESNGEDHGIEWEITPGFNWDDWISVYVFVPVEAFTITGYRTIKESN